MGGGSGQLTLDPDGLLAAATLCRGARRGEMGADAALPSLIPWRCKGSLRGADQGCRMLFFKSRRGAFVHPTVTPVRLNGSVCLSGRDVSQWRWQGAARRRYSS